MKSIYNFFIKYIYRIAWLIVTVPFVAGVLLTVVWFFIGSNSLESLLVITLIIGFWALVVGVLLIFIYAIVYRHTNGVGIRTVKLIGFYLSVIVVTLFLLFGVVDKISESTVTIQNTTNFYITEAYLVGTHHSKINLSPIKPKSTKVVSTHFGADDSIKYVIVVDSVINSGILFGYVTSGLDSKGTIIIHDSRFVEAKELFDTENNEWANGNRADNFIFEKILLDMNKSKKKPFFKF